MKAVAATTTATRNSSHTTKTLSSTLAFIFRLQEVYRLNVTEFSNGNIMGLQTGAELNAKDTFYLGRFAATNDDPEVALRWLEETVLQVAAATKTDENGTVVEVAPGPRQNQVEQVGRGRRDCNGIKK